MLFTIIPEILYEIYNLRAPWFFCNNPFVITLLLIPDMNDSE